MPRLRYSLLLCLAGLAGFAQTGFYDGDGK